MSSEMERVLEEELRRLGASGKLLGFRYTIYMVLQIMEDPDLLTQVTKRLYYETARHFDTTHIAVERNLRTLTQYVWDHGSRAELIRIAGFSLTACPSNKEMLDILAGFLRKAGRGEGRREPCSAGKR